PCPSLPPHDVMDDLGHEKPPHPGGVALLSLGSPQPRQLGSRPAHLVPSSLPPRGTGSPPGYRALGAGRARHNGRMVGLRLRDMRPDEYDSYTAQRERDTAAALAGSMSDQDALIEARRATERFLPDGLATPRHRLLVAENGSGEVVGHAWLGL